MEFWCQFGNRLEYCFEFGAWEAALDEEAVVGFISSDLNLILIVFFRTLPRTNL